MTSRALEYSPGASSPSGRTKCESVRPSCFAFAFISSAKAGKLGAVASASASAASFADWIIEPLTRSATVIAWPALEVDRLLPDGRGARVDVHDVRELQVLERDDHRHQLRDRGDRNLVAVVVLGEHLAGDRVHHEPGAGVDDRRPRPVRIRARAAGRRDDRGGEQSPHRSRSFSPMKSAVGETFGFSARIRACGTCVFTEIASIVSPARTT